MGQDVKVIAYADKAVIRLQKKFRSMIARGVNRNKAIVAVARELSCFVWGIETGNNKRINRILYKNLRKGKMEDY